jgi:hypothetical protein
MPAQPVRGDEPDVGLRDVIVDRSRRDSDWWPLDDPNSPVQSFFRWDGKSETFEIRYVQELDDLIEDNKRLLNHNDGYSRGREIRRVASIPLGLRTQWLVEEGWDAYDPHDWPKLKRKLNDPEWRHLRTAPGRV